MNEYLGLGSISGQKVPVMKEPWETEKEVAYLTLILPPQHRSAGLMGKSHYAVILTP